MTLAHKAWQPGFVQAFLANGADDAVGAEQYEAAHMEDLAPRDAGILQLDSAAQMWEVPIPERWKQHL